MCYRSCDLIYVRNSCLAVSRPKQVRKFQEVLASYLSSGILLLVILSLSFATPWCIPAFLAYGLVVWENTYATTLKPIVTLQKQALWIITFSKRDAQSSPIFSQLDLIKFMDLVTMQSAIFMVFYVSVLP